MFYHHFKYQIKILLKNKSLIFWTFAFPIILSMLFNLAFSNIKESETFKPFNISVVMEDETPNNIEIYNALKKLSNKEEKNNIFNITNKEKITEKDAKKLLETKSITGYILLKETNREVVISSNGINETILKNVMEEIESTIYISNDLIKEEIKDNIDNIDYEKIYQNVLNIINENNLNIKDISNKNLDYMTIEFYTLIAMACLYGGIVGMQSINQNFANQSNQGKRIEMSPTKKTTILLSSILASFIIEIIGVLILFLFLYFIIKIDFGSNLLLAIILSIIGSLAGLSLGVFVATVFKSNENTKIGIIIAISMACSFLSGMMGVSMKYVIDKNIPFLNKINPASMITDGFYSLYYYEESTRYIINIISLLLFSLLLFLISLKYIRRQKYDYI